MTFDFTIHEHRMLILAKLVVATKLDSDPLELIAAVERIAAMTADYKARLAQEPKT